MIKFYLTAFLSLIAFISNAQQITLTVNIKAPEKDTLFESTVTLMTLPDSTVQTRILDSSQTFDVNRNKTYTVTITAAGMQEFYRIIKINTTSQNINAELKPLKNEMSSVTVVARKPQMRQEDDKTVIDAEVLANSSTNAYEILEKTPTAVVDQDGNVYLNSATPATIQINGRDVKLSSADLASLLKSLPASSVVRIEILRNPSAKYDAASSGGILNIVLKKGVKLGTSGSINVGAFQGKYNTATIGFNINKSGDKISSYLSYQFTRRENFETLSSMRFIQKDTSVIDQSSYTTYPGISNYLGGGFDYAVNKKLNLGYDMRLSLNNSKSNAFNDISIYNTFNGIAEGENQSDIRNKSDNFYMGNNFSSRYKIDSSGSEWSASFDINLFGNNNSQIYNNTFTFPSKPGIAGDGLIDNRKNIFVAQTDLIYKLKSKYTLEAGFKLNNSGSRNNSEYFIDTNNTGRIKDIFQTNRFKYKETITSAYLQISKTFGGFTIKPGLRVETTNINGRQQIPFDTSLSIKRTDLFPYIYLRRNLFKMMGFTITGNAIYRRSISRPYYEILNPYPRYIDPYLRDIGNPDLKPQFTTNYEFNIMADDFPILSVGLNDTKDIFTNVTYQDDNTKIAYRTYDNLGNNKETYFRFAGGIPPGGKYVLYAGGQLNITNYKGLYQNTPFNYTRKSWMFFLYQNYKITPTFNATMNGYMRLKGLQNFYELNTFGALNMSFNKTILNRKGNIILSFNDIFRTNQYEFAIEQAGIRAEGIRFNDTRKIGLTFRYNFGIKPKEEKQRGFEQPAETSL